MAKKKPTESDTAPAPPSALPTEPAHARLEAYIRQDDETPRGLLVVRLEGGGNGGGTYLVDHPAPRVITHGSRYALAREDDGVAVYNWVNP